jgi:hypothetical protein
MLSLRTLASASLALLLLASTIPAVSQDTAKTPPAPAAAVPAPAAAPKLAGVYIIALAAVNDEYTKAQQASTTALQKYAQIKLDIVSAYPGYHLDDKSGQLAADAPATPSTASFSSSAPIAAAAAKAPVK